MNAIRQLEKEGYRVSLQGDKVVLKRVAGSVPDKQAVEMLTCIIRHNKTEAVVYLRSFEREVDVVVSQINKALESSWTVMDDIPQEAKDKALKLDARMTASANAGHYAEARDALEKWRDCWMPPQDKYQPEWT